MEYWTKISELSSFWLENIENIVSLIEKILSRNPILNNKITNIKSNLDSILNNWKKAEKEEIITCTDIDILVWELEKIRYSEWINRITLTQIEYIIKIIQEIRKEIFWILIKQNHKKNYENTLVEKDNKPHFKHFGTSTMEEISKVNSADELMRFYKKKNSNISNSNNHILLKIIIAKFILYKKDIIWTTINQNRIRKLQYKIKKKEPSYKIDPVFIKYIEDNIVKISNTNIKDKKILETKENNSSEEIEKTKNLLKKSLNISSTISHIVWVYNDMLDNNIENNEVLLKTIKNKIENLVKDRQRFSISDIRWIQRILFFTWIESDVILSNEKLEKKLNEKEIEKKLNKEENFSNSEIKISKYEEKAQTFLEKDFKSLEIEYQNYYRGLEMDIFIPELKLNIEIDWAHHYNNWILRNRDKKRDECLKNDWIIVERIKTTKDSHFLLELQQIIEKYNKKEKTTKQINIETETSNTNLYEDKILSKLWKIKNVQKLNLLYLQYKNYLNERASNKLLLSFVKKFNALKNDIEWNSINQKKITEIATRIQITNKQYKLPDKLLEHIEKNKTD